MARRLAPVLIWLTLGGSAVAGAQPGAPPERGYAGRSLEEALLHLTDQGLELVFTDRVVRPEMRVEREPAARRLRAVLAQLLSPHGLTTRTGVGGVLFIVPAERPTASITGDVRAWRSHQRLRGVRVTIVETGQETVTAADGRFQVNEVDAGRYFLQASRPGFMILQHEIQVLAGENIDLILELRPIPMTVEQIDVQATPSGPLGEDVSTLRFKQQELRALPRLGDDLLRPMTLLPGTSGNDLSARFHVRGGRSDEVMVRLDGLEILEPYHLLDFDGALGIVAPEIVEEAELITGALPIQYGDRMSGVLDLTTREPPWTHRTQLGLSVFLAEASSSGTVRHEKGHWLAALRVGSLEPAARVVEEEENPLFSDAFGKLELTPKPGRSLRANLLVSDDRLNFTENLGQITSAEPDEDDVSDADDESLGRVRFRTSYVNGYAWGTHQAVLGRELHVESRVSLSRVERDRQGEVLDEAGTFELTDDRQLTTLTVGQDWTMKVSRRQELQWGIELRDLDADFAYFNERELTDPLATIGNRPPEDEIDFDQRFRGRQYGAYLGDRFRPVPTVTLDVGLRYDKNTVLDDSDVSPRLSLSYRSRAQSRWRVAWGLFHQSQRLYELQVADGETRFFPSEKSEHRILGFEHIFGHDPGAQPPLTLRAELYEYRLSDPRPRFENLYDPVSLAPELEADRVRLVPQDGRARGLEIFLAGGGRRLDWFASYTYALREDRIDGRDVDRGIDQPHAVKLSLGWQAPRQWNVSLALEVHTGWPTTTLDARQTDDDGEAEIVPVLGPLYGERLPTYHRLDLSASRRFALRHGELELFFDIQNLIDASNVRGFDISFEDSSDRLQVVKDRKMWTGIAPTFGIRWSF